MVRSPWARGLACLALLLLTACSDYDRARNAYEGSDYALAIQRFEVLANAGHTQAQYDLAQIYFQGIGTAKDGQRGWYWLLSSAGGGNTAAMVQLGALFESGVGADRDFRSLTSSPSLAALTAIRAFFLHLLLASSQNPSATAHFGRGVHFPSTSCSSWPHETSSLGMSEHS